MFEIGHSLREARTRRGMSAADVQKGIRIRERYLSAIEEEHWEQLPGDAYTKGFLRTYAEFLGLDGELYIDEYNAQLRGHDDEPLVPASISVRRAPTGRTARTIAGAVVLLALIAALAAWQLGGSSNPPPTRAPAGAKASAPPRTAARVAARTPAVKTALAPAFATLSATRGDCWVSVRAGGPGGALLFEGTLIRGATKRFSLTRAVWVRMGNPNALDVRAAGKPVALPTAPANIVLSRSGARSD
jgi:transcriptional regulator with XRE-family HTH domain